MGNEICFEARIGIIFAPYIPVETREAVKDAMKKEKVPEWHDRDTRVLEFPWEEDREDYVGETLVDQFLIVTTVEHIKSWTSYALWLPKSVARWCGYNELENVRRKAWVETRFRHSPFLIILDLEEEFEEDLESNPTWFELTRYSFDQMFRNGLFLMKFDESKDLVGFNNFMSLERILNEMHREIQHRVGRYGGQWNHIEQRPWRAGDSLWHEIPEQIISSILKTI